jgi:aminopeptidase-like protein
MSSGEYMMKLARELWPLARSLSGPGTAKTLETLKRELGDLSVSAFQTGSQAFDWEVPKEWIVREAFIEDPMGMRICDYSSNNLHLVGYSTPVRENLSLDDLQAHLHSIPDQPDAIPYLTSYYRETWGFCISEKQRRNLVPGVYSVVIDADLKQGEIPFAELVIRGNSEREVFFSTYICHPSMANNELSGPVLAVALARYLGTITTHYSYRFLFIPETIGAISYLSENLTQLKSRMLAGYVLTCVGDDRTYSYLPSRRGNTVADRLAIETLVDMKLEYQSYSWGDRGSDERQYCAPGVDLPVCLVMRSKYGEYPEYHTSLDRLETVVTEKGLSESLAFYVRLIENLETKRFPLISTLCEPKLDKLGLYPTTLKKGEYADIKPIQDVISECDGRQSVEEIAAKTNLSLLKVRGILEILERKALITF